MENSWPFITIIIPCRNESAFIAKVLENVLTQNYPQNKMEVFVVDGNSEDDTIEILKRYAVTNAWIKILINPAQIVPPALNLAIKQSTGDYIIRLDAHSIYATDYVSKIVETFQSSAADIVGGPMRAEGKTDFQKAVAYCTSTKMGVGNSSFHDENASGYVDSVYLGAWKRELFKEVGYFDEQMKRNQDDEFHYRAKSKGKKIYLNPEIRSVYYPRSTAKKLFSQYFQYGLYKPLVLKKVKSEIKIRHLIPAFFVTYLLLLIPFTFYHPLIFVTPLLLYFLLSVYFGFNSKLNLLSKLYCLIIFPILHISYGLGFIIGLFKSNKNNN